MKNSEILRQAKAKIEDPKHWTTGAFGRAGARTTSNVSDATCFCMVGALRAVGDHASFYYVHPLESFLDRTVVLYQMMTPREESVCADATSFNDLSDHAEVLAAYDFAIKKAQEQELETA